MRNFICMCMAVESAYKKKNKGTLFDLINVMSHSFCLLLKIFLISLNSKTRFKICKASSLSLSLSRPRCRLVYLAIFSFYSIRDVSCDVCAYAFFFENLSNIFTKCKQTYWSNANPSIDRRLTPLLQPTEIFYQKLHSKLFEWKMNVLLWSVVSAYNTNRIDKVFFIFDINWNLTTLNSYCWLFFMAKWSFHMNSQNKYAIN